MCLTKILKFKILIILSLVTQIQSNNLAYNLAKFASGCTLVSSGAGLSLYGVNGLAGYPAAPQLDKIIKSCSLLCIIAGIASGISGCKILLK